ncbi:MAG: four helix bundle protein [Draconibacterium sp.]|nr:four helix bundle protein [Draconibacterium sp.]
MRKFNLEDRFIEYVIGISTIVDYVDNSKLGNHISGQLIRSGSSPALNYGEAQNAESRKDFVHKLKIILKELKESRICLKII